jgi:putative transposase
VRNYIHYNPVKHGYTLKWDEWPFSSAKEFLNDVGREKVTEYWESYPVFDMGQDWDKD